MLSNLLNTQLLLRNLLDTHILTDIAKTYIEYIEESLRNLGPVSDNFDDDSKKVHINKSLK